MGKAAQENEKSKSRSVGAALLLIQTGKKYR